ncbi:MAG: PDZ domain-containing protein [Thermoleophilia bacterium]
MRRAHARAALAAVVTTSVCTGVAAAQQTPAPTTTRTSSTPASTTPATTTTAPTSTTTAPTAPTAPAGPPRLANLKLPSLVTATQGHARFLVGVRTRTAAKITVQITAVKGNLLVKTVQSTKLEAAGRVYFLVDATNQQRYQLPAGAYQVRVQAADAQNRISPPLTKTFRLKLTAPRGRLDADVLQLWPSLARSLGIPSQDGQLVGAVAPGGQAAKAGIRRGDVITAINQIPTLSGGGLATALRALPADTAVPVTLRRGSSEVTVQLKAKPDWNPVPDFTRVYTVVANREPKSMAYAVARAMYLAASGKGADAQKLRDAWPLAWRLGAAGQAVQAQILEKSGQAKPALGAWNRAAEADPHMAAAQFGRGLAYNALGKDARAAAAFAKAFELDQKDSSAAAFQAFSLIRAGKTAEARQPALAAEAVDPSDANAKVAAGIALIETHNPAAGVVKLREGLLLTDDAARAQSIIDQYLEPADK